MGIAGSLRTVDTPEETSPHPKTQSMRTFIVDSPISMNLRGMYKARTHTGKVQSQICMRVYATALM